ncbi:MAG: hypothetical protein RMA76_32375 [Deltaproteobacteria bacterium]
MKRWIALLFATTSCSLALDFDDVGDLPCPCDEDHVCRTSSGSCIPRASVDDFKACATDTDPPGGDLLCQGAAICENVNELGFRCLPRCTVQSYGIPESSLRISEQCPQDGNTCWSTPRGGVCSEGVCDSTPGSCGPGRQCEFFNGAGICFTICEIYKTLDEPCAGGQVCHPIGQSRTTACIVPGARARNEQCGVEDLCSAEDGFGRAMICSRGTQEPAGAEACYAICRPGGGDCLAGGICEPAFAGIDSVSGAQVHICKNEPSN